MKKDHEQQSFIQKCLKPYFSKLMLIVLITFFEASYYSFIPFSTKLIIDGGVSEKNYKTLFLILITLIVGWVFVFILSIFRDFVYARFMADFLKTIREKIFSHLQILSMSFYKKTNSGELITYLSGDINAIEAAGSDFIATGIYPIFNFIINTCLMFFLSWKLALIAMIIWPFILLGPKLLAKKVEEENYKRKNDEATFMSVTQENIFRQLIIKSFGLRDYFINVFLQKNSELTNTIYKSKFLGYLLATSANITSLFLNVLTLVVGCILVLHDLLSVGSLMAFYVISSTTIYYLSCMTGFFSVFMQGKVSVNRIDKFLRIGPSVVDNKKAIHLKNFSSNIQFNDVNFSYDGKQQNAKNIHLTIHAKQFVAFVGGSGSGKSTLLSLLMRFFDPQKGMITIDNYNFLDVQQSSLRAMMGYVPQQPYLFNSTIRDNIRLGKLDATQAEIEWAAKAAEIHSNIMDMPAGYDTVIGESGGNLSGGQQQRISIARAIIRKPAILLLDEATSALDPITEAAINQTLAGLRVNRTVISITHRIANIQDADCIFVLDKGELSEHGTHIELIASNSQYKALWDKQQGLMLDNEDHEATITPARLQQIPILKELPLDFLQTIANQFRTENYQENSLIIKQNDEGNKFFIIAHGKVEVSKEFPDEKTIKRLSVLNDGDCFGEIALLQNAAHTATVVAMSPCICFTLQRHEFLELLDKQPEFYTTVRASSNMHDATYLT